MSLLKWVAAIAGVGVVYSINDSLTKRPRAGDTAVVAFTDLKVVGVDLLTNINPLLALAPTGVGNISVLVTSIPANPAITPIQGTAGAGIPVTFMSNCIKSLSRNSKVVF